MSRHIIYRDGGKGPWCHMVEVTLRHGLVVVAPLCVVVVMEASLCHCGIVSIITHCGCCMATSSYCCFSWSVIIGGGHGQLLLGRGDMTMATIVCLVVVGC
jgi:hypothetical protein